MRRLAIVCVLGIAGRARWLCRCDCGAECIVYRQLLIAGDTRSCGCLRSETAARAGRANAGRKRAPHRAPRLRLLDQLTASWWRS